MASAQQTAKVTASGIGYLEYLPQGYNSNSNKYPVVIALHGIKEKGTTSNDRKRILADLSKVDNVGLAKYVSQGKQYPFILISPQLKSNHGSWSGSYVMQVVNHVKTYLRIDERRIYLTGLSLGGFGVFRTAGDYPEVFAAIAPICAGGNALNKAHDIARANLPIWAFHGNNDKIVSYRVTTKMIDAVNSAPRKPNPLAKTTIFPGLGHIIWDKVYHETNVVDWMLKHRKGSAPSGDDDDDDDDNNGGHNGGNGDDDDDDDDDNNNNNRNKAPVVEAGQDQSITLPANEVIVKATAQDPDGKIASYRWTKISGGGTRFYQANTPTLKATKLQQGTYVFRLTVKDDDGATSSDDVRVVVERKRGNNTPPAEKPDNNSGRKNVRPVASAGPDRVITLPTNAITIRGNASDKDGRIVAYEWAKTYGNRARLNGANTPTVRISDLQRGIYIFRLRVRDNAGAVKDDYFKITVNGSNNKGGGNKGGGENSNGGHTDEGAKAPSGKKPNAAPSAYAGPDRVLKWPNNSISINGNASDRDGKIVSYQWTKTYGKRASLSGERTPNVQISKLQPGIYIFRLSVTDDGGKTTHDYFKVTVKK